MKMARWRSEPFDHFGFSLAAGDFNGGGHDDLAIGVPHEDIGLKLNTGVVNVIYGTSNRLSSNGDQIWDQDSPNVNGVTEPFDNFGRSLTTGDFNGDGRDDLAIGVPFEDVGSIVDGGVVNVLYGASPRLSSINDQDWHQDKSGVNGVVELFDRFGMSVASGDFDGDGRDDLAIGVPDEDVGSIGNSGDVGVLYGTSNRLSSSGDQDWHQNK